MWLFPVAFAQVVPNPSLDGPLPPSVPNELAADLWDFGDDTYNADLAAGVVPIDCLAGLLVASPDGGTFARGLATTHGVLGEYRDVISTTVTGLVPGVPYLVRFEASLVRHVGQSTGYWTVSLEGVELAGPTLALPAANPGQSAWEVHTVGPFTPTTPDAELRFEPTTNLDGTTTSPVLPWTQLGCDYGSDPVATDLLLDGVELVGDHDLDGLYDDEEAALGTDPFSSDTDADGILDPDEALIGTDPLDDDTDGDARTDGEEAADGTDPLDPDSDDDGLSDGGEALAGTDPWNDDTDGDNLPDGEEGLLGTDPLSIDTDGDNLTDGNEVAVQTDPTRPDTDDDGVPDGDEVLAGTDPTAADTDGDGLTDGVELEQGSDPLDPEDPGAPEDTLTQDTGDAGEPTPAETGDTGDTRKPAGREDTPPYVGCSCDSGSPGPAAGLSGLAALLVLARRRR
ncbi:MAG: hypothetical protein ABMA64_22640 [Myxococcota bacterium]